MADWTGLEPATSGVTGQHSNQLNYQSACGAGTRSRTRDPLITNQLLYQLSYASTDVQTPFKGVRKMPLQKTDRHYMYL